MTVIIKGKFSDISFRYNPDVELEEAINSVINQSREDKTINTNLISDGYHSFGQLYEHRIALYIALCKVTAAHSSEVTGISVWKSGIHSDGSVWEGWFLLGINKAAGEQITYHLPISEWDACYFAEELEIAPPFDGHTHVDVLERLKQL